QVPGGKGTPTAADCARVLQELAERLHRLQIGTMDGIFARVARSFGSSVGLPPVWSIALPERAARLAEVTVDEVLAGKDGKKVAKAWRVFRLKAPGLGLRAQLMETFEELRLELRGVPEDDRWEAEKGPQRLGVKETESLLIFLSEFIPPQTKNWNGAIIKLQKLLAAPPLLADFLSITLIKYIALELKDFDRQEIPEQFVDVFGPVADRARGELKRLHDLRASGLVAVAKAYDRARSMQSYLSGQYTFREIEAAALQAASGKSSDELYFRLDGRMGHILLDEFQDTSRGQFSFFEPVLKETVAKGGHVLVVGDRKQSIYGWRGSDPRLLRDVLKVLPEAATGTLSESFRSSRAVLQAVDRAFLKLENSELFEKKPEFADAVRHWVENYEKHTASAKSATQSGKVHLWVEQGESASEVRAAVMERIVARAMDHVARQEGTLGILCRTHKLIPRILAGLKKHGIEASGEGGNPLTDSAAVEMVLSLLTWVDHPGHQAARYHVCAGGMADVFGCGQVPGHGKGGEDEIAYLSWFRSEVGEKGLAEVLVKWMRDRRWVEAGTSHDHMRCAQLVELARSFDSGGGGRLAEFVRRVRAERVENPRAARVRVMTIHGAKGLEFDRVILGDLDRGVSAGGHDKPKIRVLDGAVVVLPNQDDAKMLGLETLLDEVKGEEFQEALSVL
ncbi:MAG: UvrD-helicase domain-containing protein, partial [Verrucomicrobia bacterium]|nr:UvrD-helicase domain-containing protein [Verrucomicrobiota bacterium]